MSKVRLLVADVDGTLVTSDKQLTETTIAACHRLRDAGVALALASGRPPRGLASLIEPLDIDTPLAAFNGGLIFDRNFDTIEQHAVDQDAVEPVITMMQDHQLDVWVYQGPRWFVTDPSGSHVARETATVGFRPSVVSDFTSVIEGVVKVVGVSDDDTKISEALEALRAQTTGLTVSTSQPYYLDVTSAEANKGRMIEYLARYFDLSTEQIASIGDMPTDVSMFEHSGVAIAMGNAALAVQSAATFVTHSNDDNGFAHAIDTFILKS